MVDAPLAVTEGETVPHGAGAHDTVQVTPLFAVSLVTVAVKFAVAPTFTVFVVGVTDTVTAGEGMVTIADAEAEELATEVAVMVTAKALAGAPLGAE